MCQCVCICPDLNKPLINKSMKPSVSMCCSQDRVAIAVAYDCVEKMVYWTDITGPSISKASLEGGDTISLVTTGEQYTGLRPFWTAETPSLSSQKVSCSQVWGQPVGKRHHLSRHNRFSTQVSGQSGGRRHNLSRHNRWAVHWSEISSNLASMLHEMHQEW